MKIEGCASKAMKELLVSLLETAEVDDQIRLEVMNQIASLRDCDEEDKQAAIKSIKQKIESGSKGEEQPKDQQIEGKGKTAYQKHMSSCLREKKPFQGCVDEWNSGKKKSG